MDFRILLEKLINVEHEMFEDVQLIGEELIKINASWCEVVHPDKKASDCITDICKQKDEGYTYMSERMELFRQKRITLFKSHERFKNILGRLSRKDNDLKRDVSNFFKAVFGIPSSGDYKNLVNNLNLLQNSQNTLINDTWKLAGGLNLTQLVLRKHRMELDDLHTSLLGFKNSLHVINEELIYLF